MQARAGRRFAVASAVIALIAGALLTASSLRAQQQPPAAPPSPGDAPPQETAPEQAAPSPEAAPPETPPSKEEEPAIHPDAVSVFLERAYSVKPKKLFKGLLETLKAGGYPPEEVDEAGMGVKTAFVEFKQKDFAESVVDPPPMIGQHYHILQLYKITQGKVSLEAHVAPKGRGSELRLRARILVQGLDRSRHLMIMVDRRSSGVIESEFLVKLQESLGLQRL
ncbi:MAG TPA: hypothetical protein VFT43_14815 [Candidatus Polarisedimenticolia bacterium]|nr:hypothetical protein [Candidatus Polarisedimenticolia bacterium]